jgi:hypothetical protein
MVNQSDEQRLLNVLEEGYAYRFSDWPNAEVPQAAAGVYTIWNGGTLVYVGMSGRGMSTADITTAREQGTKKGLYTRLQSHAAGRRSGDQFCVYVCDRLVLKSLTVDDVGQVADGQLSLDGLTREYIHEHLSYRFVEAPDGQEAARIEAVIRSGGLAAGKPLLNPDGPD